MSRRRNRRPPRSDYKDLTRRMVLQIHLRVFGRLPDLFDMPCPKRDDGALDAWVAATVRQATHREPGQSLEEWATCSNTMASYLAHKPFDDHYIDGMMALHDIETKSIEWATHEMDLVGWSMRLQGEVESRVKKMIEAKLSTRSELETA